jgi:predicted nuclease of restriction endonuclease-like (RecB) superfamily
MKPKPSARAGLFGSLTGRSAQLYERIALSQNKAAIAGEGSTVEAGDSITPEEAIKDPFVLEFSDLKDE